MLSVVQHTAYEKTKRSRAAGHSRSIKKRSCLPSHLPTPEPSNSMPLAVVPPNVVHPAVALNLSACTRRQVLAREHYKNNIMYIFYYCMYVERSYIRCYIIYKYVWLLGIVGNPTERMRISRTQEGWGVVNKLATEVGFKI